MSTIVHRDEESANRFAVARVQEVLPWHQSIASALQNNAFDLSAALRRRVLQLSRRLHRGLSIEQALGDVDALAVLVPLSKQADVASLPQRIDAAVGDAIIVISQTIQPPRLRLSQLIYPLLILGLTGLVFMAYAIFLVPVFDSMFQEFDLELPWITNVIVSISRGLQQVLLPLVVGIVVLLSLALMFVIWRRYLSSDDGSRRQTWDHRRTAMAKLAWHLSLLLDAGFSRLRAIEIAGERVEHPSIRMQVEACRKAEQNASPESDNVPQVNGLLYQAMQLRDVGATVDLLRELAAIERERRQRVSTWATAWLTPVSVVIAGTLATTMLAALLLPLVSLISALS